MVIDLSFMPDLGWAVLYALFVWWFSTGVIIYLDLLPQRTFRWSFLGASVVAGAALYDLAATRADSSFAGAYHAFTGALLIWGWQLIAFYMGYVTGPRTEVCSDEQRGWQRFGHGVQACLYHELAAAAGAAVVIWLTWHGANQIGVWTYLVLWGMHQSAKLNVFLGVPNLNAHFLPAHLTFLKGLMRVRPMNLLFPISITLSLVVTTLLIERAVNAASASFAAVGYTFVATLMVLAILEHWFLVLPLPAEALWAWSLKARRFVERSQRRRSAWSTTVIEKTLTTPSIQTPAIQTHAGRH
jgi:putative photosynthetic complex assembly protein 2